MRSLMVRVGFVVMLLGWVVPASAQSAASGWQLAPRAGVFYPTRALGLVPISPRIAGSPVEYREARLGAGAAVGITFLRELSSRATRVRLDVDYVPPVEVEVDDSNLGVQASVASAVLVVEQLLTRNAGLLQPYVAGGAGLRSYRFQPWLSAGPQFPNSQSSPAVRLGAGVVLRVLVASISAEVSDQLSWFRFSEGGARRMQNELHGVVGIRLNVF